MRRLGAAIAAALLLAAPAAHATAQDTFRSSAAFIRNCDARPDVAGNRPPENIPCLSYIAGLIEGYTAGAIAGGMQRPYCLNRPVTLLEMMDMIVEVIDRGVPPNLPTAAVFHMIIAENFPCRGVPPPPFVAPEPAE